MSTPVRLQVLQPENFADLIDVLDRVVAADDGLGPARSKLLRPLRSLKAMAAEAVGALGDDVLAAERLRLLVSSSGSRDLKGLSLLAEGGVLLASDDAGSTSALEPDGQAGLDVAPCELRLLDLGALVIVGLAAGRVGLGLGFSAPFIGNVLGLAVAAGPAEAVARAIADGMSTEQIGTLLAGFGAQDSGGTGVSSVLSTSLADNCERQRWACLSALFQVVRSDIVSHPWDASASGLVRSVEPSDACAGATVKITLAHGGSDDVSGPPPDGLAAQPRFDANHFMPRLAKGTVDVLFASAGRRTLGRRPTNVDEVTRTVSTRVPKSARSGWVGLVDSEAVAAVNQARAEVRAKWQELNATARCLAGTPVPTEAIATLPKWPTPPRSPGARFEGGFPSVVTASLEPKEVSIGDAVELRWRVAGAAPGGVTISPGIGAVPSSGRRTMVATGDTAVIEYTLVATNACGEVRASASARVRSNVEDRTLVIVRPAFLGAGGGFHRVDVRELEQSLPTPASRRGGGLQLLEPAWLDDDEVTLRSTAFGSDAPATVGLLETLNLLATRSSGLEDAVWLAVVPRSGEVGFLRLEPGDGARAVAVCTPDQINALLAEPLPTLAPMTERLRVLGTIAADDTVHVGSVLREERMAGPGASLATGILAVGRSERGEHVMRELRVLSATRPARFAALLPITQDVSVLEIRSPRARFVARERQSRGAPSLSSVALDANGILSWSYNHSASARGRFMIEVARSGGWSPIAYAGPCETDLELALERLRPAPGRERLRVVASDGWNATVAPKRGLRYSAPKTRGALARFAGDRTFWADVGASSAERIANRIEWTFDKTVVMGPVLRLPREFQGEVRLSVPGMLDDVRTVAEDGTVEPRGLGCSGCGGHA